MGLLQGTFVWEGAEQLYCSRDIFWHCTLQLFVFHSVETTIVELLGMTEKNGLFTSKRVCTWYRLCRREVVLQINSHLAKVILGNGVTS